MKLPKELTGTVEKFENMILDEIYWEDIFNFRDFYTQEFIPEMIEKYFEGWSIDMHTLPNHYNYLINDKIICNNFGICFDSNGHRINPTPKTLSDFVDSCLNSDIKLNWNKK